MRSKARGEMGETIFNIRTLAAVLDIFIVAAILYWLMLMFRGSKAERMLWGFGVIVIIYFVSQRVELLTLHWIISNFLGSMVIFIIVVFQQDIRKALVRMGRPFSTRDTLGSLEFIDELARAVAVMSRKRTGGIVAIERGNEISDYIEGGVEVDARFSKELLLSIFNSASPVHDGAVVVRKGRLSRAGCILPLTEEEVSPSMGTRHRAAMGLAEQTDAVVIVVSEETGEATLVVDGRFNSGMDPDELLGELKRLFSDEAGARRGIFAWKAGA